MENNLTCISTFKKCYLLLLHFLEEFFVFCFFFEEEDVSYIALISNPYLKCFPVSFSPRKLLFRGRCAIWTSMTWLWKSWATSTESWRRSTRAVPWLHALPRHAEAFPR